VGRPNVPDALCSWHRVIHYEQGNEIAAIISREKQLKAWKRKWKLALTEKANPEWNDLWYETV
jgi:putative endonuclease